MQSKKFQRTPEDFSCENCGKPVEGNGYTNHCPACLWSKHVDVNPGDRQSDCHGMMQPIAIEQKEGAYVIVHQCKKCGHTRRNKVVSADDMNVVIRIAAQTR